MEQTDLVDFVPFTGLAATDNNTQYQANSVITTANSGTVIAATSMVIVPSSGNVGIGTTNPSAGLDSNVSVIFRQSVGIGTVTTAGISANVVSIYGTAMQYGNIVLSNVTAGGVGIYFPDGTYQTTAASGTGTGTSNYGNANVANFLSGNVLVGNLYIGNSTVSTSTSTGALIMNGGAGIGGNLNVGGTAQLGFVNVGNSMVAATVLSNSSVQSAGTATVNALISNVYGAFGQNVTINSTNASINSSTGALVVTGGQGLGGNLRVAAATTSLFGGNLGIGTTATLGATANVFTVYGSSNLYGNVIIANTTAGGSGIYFPDGTLQVTAFNSTNNVISINFGSTGLTPSATTSGVVSVAYGTSATTAGIFSPIANTISLGTANAERLRVTNQGNVLINSTATPSISSSTMVIRGIGTNNGGMEIQNSAGTAGGNITALTSPGALSFGAGTGSYNEVFRIVSQTTAFGYGNLLINSQNTTPTGPTAALVVNSALGGGIELVSNGNGGANIAAPSSAVMTFSTFVGTVGAEVYTERMRINSGGNLLIGTVTAPLGGNATVVIAGTGTNGGGIELAGSSTGGGNIAGLSSGGLVFGTFTGAVGSEVYAERMRLAPNGNVLYNTTSLPLGGNSTVVIQGLGTNGGGIELSGGALGGGNIFALNGGGMAFATYVGAVGNESYTEALRIDTANNIGIRQGLSTVGTATFNAIYSNSFVQAAGTVTAATINSNGTIVSNAIYSNTFVQAAGTVTAAAINSNGTIVGSSMYSNGFVQAVDTVTAASIYSNTFVQAVGTVTAASINSNGAVIAQSLTSNVYGAFGQNVTINSTNASINSSTGALIVAGGVGVAGNLYVGGNIIVTGNLVVTNVEVVNTTLNTMNIIVTGGNISTSTTTGAIILNSNGGMGLGGNINAGGQQSSFAGNLSINGSNLSVSSSTGALVLSGANAGLGVAGNIWAGGNIVVAANGFQFWGPVIDTAATPGYAWNGELQSGMFNPTAGVVAFSTAAVERFRINSASNLLINGTTAPAGGNAQVLINSVGTNAGGMQLAGGAAGGGNIYGINGGGLVMGTYTGAVGTESYAERLRIDLNGNVGLSTASAVTGFTSAAVMNTFTGRVGIGTATNSYVLSSNVMSVFGTAMHYGNLVIQNVTSGVTGIYFQDGTFQSTAYGGAGSGVSSFNAGTTGMTPTALTTGAVTLGFGAAATAAGIFSPAANTISLSTASIERVRVTSVGNLLVNTTAAITNGNSTVVIQSVGTNGGGVQLSGGAGGGGNIQAMNSGGLQFATYTGAVGSETYTERMRITTNGNILVGQNLIPPGGGNVTLVLTGQGTNAGGIQLVGGNSGATSGGGNIYGINGGGLVFGSYTSTVGLETYSERLRINSFGNILIGTAATPAGQGNSTVVINSTGTNGGGIELVSGNNGGGNIYAVTAGGLVFSTHTGAVGSEIATERFRIGPAGQLGIAGIVYGTANQVLTSGGPSAAASWTSVVNSLTTSTGLSTNTNATGAVSITNTGVTSLTTSSGLSTNTNATGAVSITNTGVTQLTAAGTGVTVTGSTGAVTVQMSGSYTGTFAVTGAITATGEITAYSSDQRLKENVQLITDPLTKIMSLRGVMFDWKQDTGIVGFEPKFTHDVGVIAQEIQAVLPEAVRAAPFDTNADGTSRSGHNYLTVQYEKLTALLIEAVKAQQSQIAALEARITFLELDP